MSKLIDSPSSSPHHISPVIENLDFKRRIAIGKYGKVFEVYLKKEREDCAVKISQKERGEKSNILKERNILKLLDKEEGFPRFKDMIWFDDYELLIMSLLGPNLRTLLNLKGGKFELKTVLMIGIQTIQRIERLHDKGFLHCDIKPENFVIGLTELNQNIIHMIDFGFSRSYLDIDGSHIEPNASEYISGSPYYLSTNAHAGVSPSRRDDLVSLGYMLLEMINGKLPWAKVEGSYEERVYAAYQIKKKTGNKRLCKGMPKEFLIFFDYVTNLGFTEKPDYAYLIRLFRMMLAEKNLEEDGNFSWNFNEEEIFNEKPNIFSKYFKMILSCFQLKKLNR